MIDPTWITRRMHSPVPQSSYLQAGGARLRALAAPVGRALLVLAFVIGLTAGLHSAVTVHHAFGADFFTFWLAGRAMFVEGASPYAEHVTLQSQMGIYGRAATALEDQVAFVYPPYSLFAIWPTVWMSYSWAQAYWMALHITLFLCVLLFAFRRLPRWVAPLLLFSYPVMRGIFLGQFGLTVGICLLFVWGIMAHGRRPGPRILFVAGAVLAWTTIKPQLSAILILFLLLYALRHRFWTLWSGFGSGLVALALASWWWLPGWTTQWLAQVQEYSGYVQGHSLAGFFALWAAPHPLRSQYAALLTVAVAAATLLALIAWWRGRTSALHPLAWSTALTLFIHPNVVPSELVVFLLPFATWLARPRATGLSSVTVTTLVVLVPWLVFVLTMTPRESHIVTGATALLFIALWFIWLVSDQGIAKQPPTPCKSTIDAR
jgi:hypothetical protein